VQKHTHNKQNETHSRWHVSSRTQDDLSEKTGCMTDEPTALAIGMKAGSRYGHLVSIQQISGGLSME
jgi:hypothetical protein